jgi:uncharacterized protein YdhG (YjbR/CyaY superfamily)
MPDDVQKILEKIRQIVRKAAPEAVEAISYQIPAFKLNGRSLVFFAAFKDHVSIYPVPSGPPSFQKELSPYVGGKGTIRFLLGRPVPYDLVKRIVANLIKERLAENPPLRAYARSSS